ncbi:site-2 protease family protein [uncultured Cohaesibacter sp.]|uniref:site-2 protease family protein n=1 Tax=uncultured Cohaesibacter sp. TaxID=1002546 RepID=UPI0029C94E5F|nr:site-2 protease family protein [uncultured Cohaesibacter sp.]
MSDEANRPDDRTMRLRLRQDLVLHPAMPDVDGSAGWILSDPVQHRYFRINEATYRILLTWLEIGGFGDALVAYRAATGETIDDAEVARLLDFVRKGNLLDDDRRDVWRQLSGEADRTSMARMKRLLSQYLFFKVPLFHPQPVLERALPYVRPLMSRSMLAVIGVLVLYALYVILRQWDAFTASVNVFLSPQGAFGFLLVLVLLKVLHELGHAFVAVSFGVRVPVMGVAFMLLTPLLYTDVSDGWKLAQRRQRMAISGAGIVVETALAALATCLWSMAGEGALRSILFMVAGTAWVSSLAINLNPLMRFDGYYLLADWLGMDNLQPRAFTFGKWKVRQWLLKPDLAAPETVPQRLGAGLVVYAFSIWVYRLVLFTTIALAVYHFAFKLLGIALFCVEIGLLILWPVARELGQWRSIIRLGGLPRRLKWSIGALALLVMLFVVPLPGRVSVPAVLVGSDLTRVYAERAGRIAAVPVQRFGALVEGDVLIALDVPKLESDIEDSRIRLASMRTRLLRAGAGAGGLDEAMVLKQQYASLQTEYDGLSNLRQTMTLRARTAGTVVQLAPDLHPGRWVQKGALLAIVSEGAGHVVQGYLAEAERVRLDDDASGRFVPDDLQLASFPVKLERVAAVNSEVIDLAELASVYGGAIAVSKREGSGLMPQVAQYRADFNVSDLPFQPRQVVRGVVHLPTRPRSSLISLLDRFFRVFNRESGF